jgi:hypothetical protein
MDDQSKKTILVVDDNERELQNIEIELKKEYKVITATSIDRADQIIHDAKSGNIKIDLIIADLNMSNELLGWKSGKSEEDIKTLKRRTHGGAFTGWIWLYYFALPQCGESQPKAIIYSGFIEDLLEEMQESDIDSDERAYFNNEKQFKTVSKFSGSNSVEELKETVDKLLNEVN